MNCACYVYRFNPERARVSALKAGSFGIRKSDVTCFDVDFVVGCESNIARRFGLSREGVATSKWAASTLSWLVLSNVLGWKVNESESESESGDDVLGLISLPEIGGAPLKHFGLHCDGF